jgi:hypothetical protein
MAKDTELRSSMVALTQQWRDGGQNKKTFCKQHSINYYKFNYWCRRLGVGRRIVPLDCDTSFVELDMSALQQASWVEVVYPDGRKILFHREVGADFLKSLLN